MPRKRVYTEREFSAVLKRAAELQRIEGVDDSPGLFLDELEEVAADAGINPDFVRRAALELDEAEPEKGDLLVGGPTNLDLDLLVEGEMSDTRWEDAVGEIRRAFSAEGETRQEGRTMDWIHRDQMGGRVHVSMSPAGDQTRVRISYGMKEWLWLYVVFLSMGIGGVAVTYAVLTLGTLLETGAALLVMMVSYVVAWLSFRFFTRKQDRKARKLRARLDDLLSDADANASEQLAASAATELGRIDPSLLSDNAPTEGMPRVPRRGREGT